MEAKISRHSGRWWGRDGGQGLPRVFRFRGVSRRRRACKGRGPDCEASMLEDAARFVPEIEPLIKWVLEWE